MWLHGKAQRTIVEYQADVQQFAQFVGKPLAEVALEDLQAFATHLEQRNLKDSSRTRKINAIKSLFTFAAEQTHIPFNVAAALKPPKTSPNLAGRILTKEAVVKIINAGATDRDRLFLLVMYAIATRISETCTLRWQNFTIQSNGKVQVSIHGKGGKVAPVLVPSSVWEGLQTIRTDNDRVFPFSRRTGHNIVKQAVKRAGLDPRVSAHWFRHSHARHAIEAGAPIHLVRDTLRHSNISVTNWYLESFPDQSSSDYLEL